MADFRSEFASAQGRRLAIEQEERVAAQQRDEDARRAEEVREQARALAAREAAVCHLPQIQQSILAATERGSNRVYLNTIGTIHPEYKRIVLDGLGAGFAFGSCPKHHVVSCTFPDRTAYDIWNYVWWE